MAENKELKGYCPVCRELFAVEDCVPQYPDDPMLEPEDFFKLPEHENKQTGLRCDCVDKPPTGWESDEEQPGDDGMFGDAGDDEKDLGIDQEDGWPEDPLSGWPNHSFPRRREVRGL